jgi:hypothetical protein
MLAPSNSTVAALHFTQAELAHVVTRHAAVLRHVLHGEDVMGPLGLHPYAFNSGF